MGVLNMRFNKFNNAYNIVGEKLKEIREKKNVSQEELSSKLSLLGITLYQSDIFKIEHNERTVRDFELWGICQVLEVKSEDLYKPNI